MTILNLNYKNFLFNIFKLNKSKIITLDYIKNNEEFILSEMKAGKIFIYPTDTLFGIGCISNNDKSIKKIYKIKKRKNKSLLIIIPNLNWIKKNCIINKSKFNLIKSKLPGEYSFILKLKKSSNEISDELFLKNDNKNINNEKNININNDNNNFNRTIGIRIPNCYFSKLVEKLNMPFITTSVNISGKKPATKISEIDKEIIKKVDYILENDSKLIGIASNLFDLSKNEIIKIR